MALVFLFVVMDFSVHNGFFEKKSMVYSFLWMMDCERKYDRIVQMNVFVQKVTLVGSWI